VQHGEDAANQKSREDQRQVHDADPLVVDGQEPALDTLQLVEIIGAADMLVNDVDRSFDCV
jgi:hypothetical protein